MRGSSIKAYYFISPSIVVTDILSIAFLEILWATGFIAENHEVSFDRLQRLDWAAMGLALSSDWVLFSLVEGISSVPRVPVIPLFLLSFILPTAIPYRGSTPAVYQLPFSHVFTVSLFQST